MSQDLRTFLAELEAKSPEQIWRVSHEIDGDYDIAALLWELERRGERRIAPRLVSQGPVKELVLTGADVDLGTLPIIRHFAEDAGPYITNGIVVAKDPDTGYASERSTQHVFDVTAILRRRNALYQDIAAGISAEHTTLLAVPQEARLLRVLRANFPTVKAVAYPQSGTCRLHCYISMKVAAEGQAKNAALAAFGDDISLELVIVVDDDVDVTREDEVMWAVATRMQADQDLSVIPNAMSAILDPSTRNGTTAKVVIDATRPVGGTFARRHTLPPDALARAAALIGARGR